MFTKQVSLAAFSSLFLPGLFFTQSVLASWTLNEENSSFYYVTSKAAAVSELNTFTGLSGEIGDDGSASLEISLASVDTAIDVRNERMREIVFQVGTHPLASIRLKADGRQLVTMAAGERVGSSYQAAVELNGIQQELAVEIVVSKLKNGGLLVVLAKPLIINAATFDLAHGVEQLREIAGLPSINNNVVIDFTLQYDDT